ncbi:hypothetical protein [Sediminicoccus sp. KRV36]|uniref:extracellular solute-binding protein n=1 Tax=Sediminicoccus sp. KRV36 TaxID=3133721 RepID=UPI00200C8288|nr:hypothetical protein [Sediminicoccus rosea]UPY38603.1 hypothetical protein LHU95_07870 [Sediminicoccus rosea]
MLLSRRAVLALPLACPRIARGQDLPLALRVVVAGESLPRMAPLVAGFAAAKPELIRQVDILRAEPAWIGGPFAEVVRAGQPIADAVLTDTAGLVIGATRELWQPLPAPLRRVGGPLGSRSAELLAPLAQDIAVVVAAAPGGPLLLHRSAALPNPPRTAPNLLEYARQNPGRFLYPRPAQSLLGLQFISALPYLLGDMDPGDPQKGWEHTWGFLAELGRHVPYYPTSATAALEEMAEEGCDMLPALLSTFLRERTTGLLPEDTRFELFEDGPLLPLGLFLAVPRHVPPERLPVVAALAEYLFQPEVQLNGFGRGLLPGSVPELAVVADGVLSTTERAAWNQLLPPATAERIARRPLAPPLSPLSLAYMLRRWDEEISARFRSPD